MLKLNFRLIVCSIVIAMFALSASSAILPTSGDLQPSNPYWNGLQAFFNAVNATELDTVSQKVIPDNSVLFIIGPSLNITHVRVEALEAYVGGGGTLVLMDETGIVNPILSSFGLDVGVDGRYMLDALFYYRSWRVPKIVDVKEDALTLNVESIAMNLPSTLNVGGSSSNVKVLACSSSFSFLDVDGDYKPSPEEPAGPFVVAVEAAYGRGHVIVFSDSSLFINSAIGLGDNLQLLRNIVGDKAAFVDISVWHIPPQLVYRDAVLNAYRILSAPEFKYSLAFAALTAIYMLTRREKPVLKDDEVGDLLRRHPGWDRRLLEALKEAREKIGK